MSLPLLQSLLQETCVALDDKAAKLEPAEARELCAVIDGWEMSSDNNSIFKTFTHKNYYETIAFVNAVAWIAHQQDHHPDMYVTYKQCKITYSTHTVGGLSRNDFICAARINQLLA